jgi:hypothetical protein
MSKINTKWVPWGKRNTISNKNQPAIYYIAHVNQNIEDEDFSYIKDIVYIGMTISKSGLKGRLEQFEKAMYGSDGVHGGAERVRFKHKDANSFFENAYVSACIFELSDNRNSIVLATDCLLVGFFKDVLLYILSFCSFVNVLLISVSIKPATIQFERIPFLPHSLAVFFENASKEPFVDAYIDNPLYPV